MSHPSALKEKADILILTENEGGHLVTANAMAAALSVLQPSLQIRTIDFIEQMFGSQLKIHSRKMYYFANKYLPTLYRWYCSERVDKILSRPQLKNRAASFAYSSLQRYLDDNHPRLIIATHNFPVGAVGEMKRRGLYSGAAATIITDHFVHSHWIHPGIDLYLVASERVQQELIKRCIPAERIIVTGIPIDSAFGVEHDRTQLRRQMGLAKDLPMVLVMGGMAGIVGGMVDVCSILSRFPVPLQAVIITGKNSKMRERLKSIATGAQHPIYVKGFVDDLPTWMGAADILISKSGGLTVSEAMASQLPMLIYRPYPCQEEANARYLVGEGAAMWASDCAHLEIQLLQILSQPQLLAQMKRAASKLSKANAAQRAAMVLSTRYLA